MTRFYIGPMEVSPLMYAEYLRELGLEVTIRERIVDGNIFDAQSKVLAPIPYDQWPLWAKALRQFSKPEDTGIGDVVSRMIGDENSAAFSAWYLATFHKPCGCKGRQIRWNKLYPLP